MGNGVTRMSNCFAISAGDISRRHDIAVYITDPLVQDSLGLGHSFCYIRSDHQPAAVATPAARRLSNKVYSDNDETTSASATSSSSFFRTISGASVSANTSTPPSTAMLDSSSGLDRVSSTFESSDSFASIPLQPVPRGPTRGAQSGPIERGFLSGPIERGFLSGPIDRGSYFSSSGPVIVEKNKSFIKSFSLSIKPKKRRLIKAIKRVFSRSVKLVGSKGTVPISPDSSGKTLTSSGRNEPGEEEEEGEEAGEESGFSIGGSSQDLQWAQGKAGEDRMHVVVSEEKGWVFVGIYDGFNGPDAPDYLVSNLYNNVHQELEGLLWVDGVSRSTRKSGKSTVSHPHVLRALWEGLRRTEEGFFEVADVMGDENPELALMGSCVLVMLMKGEDVYLMNVGDSRAVLAQSGSNGTDDFCGSYQNLRMIHEERLRDVGAVDDECSEHCSNGVNLRSIQLTMDHSTYVDKEVKRIKREHPDDASAVMNDRVKGYLKVTRAFGVGFLKQPKWNDKLLEMFQIDYIGTSPYITCNPSLNHHRLNSRDRFLILSSDGLYQYFTNEEVVEEVESFLSEFPEGDPAQHLIEEVLFRAAKKAGMDFHELLDVPQGDRRRYHDDVSVIIISLEGRIWGSSV